MVDVPPELEQARIDLIEAIEQSFAGVTRVGGMSWRQAELEDGVAYSDEEYRAAGRKDSETAWQQLVGSRIFEGCPSEWSFLDPIGYRYYLPACMITYLTLGENAGCLSDELTLNRYRDQGLLQYRIRQWSLLDSAQRASIVQFIRFMGEWLLALAPESDNYWDEALKSYWVGLESEAN